MKVAKPSLSQMSDQLLDRDVVAEPLVRELVDDEARGAAADRRVGGPGLVLQREARVEAGRDAADDRERVVAEVLLEAGDDRRGLLHQPHAGRLVALAQLLRDRDEPRQAAVLALLDREVAGGEEREVGHHRLVGAPVPLRRVLADLAAAQLAVGDDLAAVGDRDLHVDDRLVERVVVGGEPPRRHVRLVHRDDLVLAGQPVALPGVGVPRRVVVVRHHDGVLAAGRERLRRGDPQLVPAVGLVEARLLAVDGHLRDRRAGSRGRSWPRSSVAVEPDRRACRSAAWCRARSGCRSCTSPRRCRRCRRAASRDRRCRTPRRRRAVAAPALAVAPPAPTASPAASAVARAADRTGRWNGRVVTVRT